MDEPLTTWQPPRGPLTKLVAWIILLVFGLCVLVGAVIAISNILNIP